MSRGRAVREIGVIGFTMSCGWYTLIVAIRLYASSSHAHLRDMTGIRYQRSKQPKRHCVMEVEKSTANTTTEGRYPIPSINPKVFLDNLRDTTINLRKKIDRLSLYHI